MRASPHGDRLALLAALLLFAALALFGHRYHRVEEAGSAERDGYVAQAEQLLAGGLPRDPYRPLLYPLATAGLATVVGDPFVAARLLSNLAAAALAWLAYAHGRRLAGPAAGGWAMALAAANPNLWILGQHVSTDMPFAALAAAALLAAFSYLEAPRRGAALAAGLALGLAAFTRANAVFLLPALVAAWWLAPGEGQRGRGRRWPDLAWGAAAAALALLPHWLLRRAAFGDPFHDENWKNLAWKLHGYPDWSYLDRVPYAGALAVLRDDPGAVLRGGLAELARFLFGGGAAQLLGTWAHVLLFAAGAAFALSRRPRAAGWLLFAGATFLAATAFSFFTWGRLLLLLLPASYALAFSPWGADGPAAGRRWQRPVLGLLGAALVLLLAAKTFAFRLPAFVAHHPNREVAILERLDRELPPGAALAGSSPYLGRYLRHPYLYLPDAFGPEVGDPRLYFRKLGARLAGSGVAFLVIGGIDLRDRPPALAGAAAPVPWLRPVLQAPGVAIWRLDPGLTRRLPGQTVASGPATGRAAESPIQNP
jgi:4-amino-4-deoxy-L-arabinose transferase-like glycosyltransferase